MLIWAFLQYFRHILVQMMQEFSLCAEMNDYMYMSLMAFTTLCPEVMSGEYSGLVFLLQYILLVTYFECIKVNVLGGRNKKTNSEAVRVYMALGDTVALTLYLLCVYLIIAFRGIFWEMLMRCGEQKIVIDQF